MDLAPQMLLFAKVVEEGGFSAAARPPAPRLERRRASGPASRPSGDKARLRDLGFEHKVCVGRGPFRPNR